MSDTLSEKIRWVKTHLDKNNPTKFPFNYNDLIQEYFDKRMKYYLSQQKGVLGTIYIEKNAIQRFKEFEKQTTFYQMMHLARNPRTAVKTKKIDLLIGYRK